MDITPNFVGWKAYLSKFIKKTGRYISSNKQKISEGIANGYIRSFFGVMMDEIIDNNSIFVEPNNSFAIAIAQRKSDSKKYKYDIETRSGNLICYIVLNPKFFRHIRKNYYIYLSKHQKKRIADNIKAGKRYITYEQLINQLDYGYL